MVTPRSTDGFTLAELLVAMAVTVIALGLAAGMLNPVSVAFQSLPEAADAQQRLRAAAQALADDIAGAGSGPLLGWAAHTTPAWPAVLPCRWAGEPLASRPGGCAQPDAITMIATDAAAPQAILAAELTTLGSPLTVAPLSACVLAQPACRFHEDGRAVVADGAGAWDLLQLNGVSADGTTLLHDGWLASRTYRAGAMVAETGTAAYSLRVDPATRVSHLRRSTDGSADMPVADHVTVLQFEYFGLPAPPAVLDDGDLERRRTTYGPLPPPDGVDETLDAWLPGENCQFLRVGGAPAARQAALPIEQAGLARLPLGVFTDGPWCPDGASPNRYDADLLRIRLVRVTLRVQAQSPAVRGLDARLFGEPGSAREAGRLVPDMEVRVDVALRNR
jgi:prepilin-type N-terminal cleavage/methylation domain-containing protein